MQHIDRKALYTDLEARVEYLHSFLDFGQSTSTPPPGSPELAPHPPQNQSQPTTYTPFPSSQATSTPSSPGASTSKP